MGRLIQLAVASSLVLSCSDAAVPAERVAGHTEAGSPLMRAVQAALSGSPTGGASWVSTPGVVVTHAPLAPAGDRYDEPHGSARGDAVEVELVADGETLVAALSGAGPWYERSTVVLEFVRRSDAPLELRAASVAWSADVPPFSAYLQGLHGRVVVADAGAELAVAVSLAGRISPETDHDFAVSGAFRRVLPTHRPASDAARSELVQAYLELAESRTDPGAGR